MSNVLLDEQRECAELCSVGGVQPMPMAKGVRGRRNTSNMEMYNERPTTIVEKRVYEETGHGGSRGNDYSRSTRERANAGLTLGIIGTAAGVAALWGRGGLSGLIGGGNNSNGGGLPANVNINGVPAAANGVTTYVVGGCGRSCPTAFEAYEKSCDNAIALTNAFWKLRENGILEAQAARNTDVAEKFGLYSALVNQGFSLYKENRDNIDVVNNRINNELFSLYKYTRDKDDETRKELCELKSQVAIAAAIRPYQDELINCKIKEAFTAGINYVDRRTCKMLEGVVTLPTEPTVTGLTSYCCCRQAAAAAAPAAGA